MAELVILKKSFTDLNSGEIKAYERLGITGFVNGERQTLELKLDKSEMLLAKIIISSKEEEPVVVQTKATEDEADEFFLKNSGSGSDDKIDLNED